MHDGSGSAPLGWRRPVSGSPSVGWMDETSGGPRGPIGTGCRGLPLRRGGAGCDRASPPAGSGSHRSGGEPGRPGRWAVPSFERRLRS